MAVKRRGQIMKKMCIALILIIFIIISGCEKNSNKGDKSSEYISQNISEQATKDVMNISQELEYSAEKADAILEKMGMKSYDIWKWLRPEKGEETEKFLNQVSDYSYSLSRKNIYNEDVEIKIVDNEYDADFITHSGTFHADEVMATVILLNKFGSMKLFRSTNPKNDNAFIYDVGFGAFDHHGIDFDEARENGVKYASCGLIWRAFGNDIVSKLDVEDTENFVQSIDKNLIMDIDRDDNGQTLKNEPEIKLQNIPNLIGSFNPVWNDLSSETINFLNAVSFAKKKLSNLAKNTLLVFSLSFPRKNLTKPATSSWEMGAAARITHLHREVRQAVSGICALSVDSGMNRSICGSTVSMLVISNTIGVRPCVLTGCRTTPVMAGFPVSPKNIRSVPHGLIRRMTRTVCKRVLLN